MSVFYLYTSHRSLYKNALLSFQSDINTFTMSFEKNSSVSYDWLLNLQSNYEYLFYLYDNGIPFRFTRDTKTEEEKQLIEGIRLYYSENIPAVETLYTAEHQEFSYGHSGENYHVSVIMIPGEKSSSKIFVVHLWDDEFSAEDIKRIYKMRWGIETSFRELKYHIGLIAFHSKKKDCVIQEIFASLIMYNFSMLITENIAIDDKRNKYRSKVNYAIAIHICIAFFRYDHVSPSHLEKLIARNKCPVRPDRLAIRKSCYHSAIGFNYRLS